MIKSADIFDDDVELTITNTLLGHFGNSILIQAQGISTDAAPEDAQEWLRSDLLNGDDVPMRRLKKRLQTRRRGLFQVACSSRYSSQAKNKSRVRCWQLAKQVYRLFVGNSLSVLDSQLGGGCIGCMTITRARTDYVDENQIAKSQARGFLDPSNVHSVIVTFNYQVNSN